MVDEILPKVSKPSRYIGMEWNAVTKDPATASVRIALAFPDTYEIGMSHLGLKILYQILNRRPEFMAERVYAPWTDAEALLRQHRIPLCSLESGYSLADFDLIGFTLQYELSYTNILNMLDLAGIPLTSAERREGDPFVIGGGSVGFNPEPIAEFFDLFVLGDGEEVVLEICEAAAAWKGSGGRREALLEAWARIPGCYVPALHQGETIRKRTAIHLDGIDYGAFPVPFMEIVHDRVSIEVMRGCTQGCRFCQAGYLYRPLRERSAEEIRALAAQAVRQTGYEEVSLASLSIADLTVLPDVVPSLMDQLTPEKISLSLPSLRVETLNRFPQVAEEISRVRKTGFTIAPEAGSRRLRKVINKEGFDEEQIFTAVRNAAKSGWESVKFYFMIGLPTETQEDLDELVRITRESARIARAESARGFGLTVSTSPFVPKPHTPFQWFAQDPMELLQEKQEFLKRKLREVRVSYKWHNVRSSFLEAVFSLGDRSLGPAIRRGYELGCRLDGWTEHLKFDRWMQAFDETGIDPKAIANRPRNPDEPLPWDHIDTGVTKAFLQREYKKALEARTTVDCHTSTCTACGEICMPNWPAWAEQVGMDIGRRQAAGGRCGANPQPPTPNPQPIQRLRFVFQKVGMLRFLSHLEVMRALSRALRRAGIAVAYSQGFNPQPKLSLALALPVGVEGLAELGDLELRTTMAPEELSTRVNRCLVDGLQLVRAWEVPLTAPSLTTSVREGAYRVSLPLDGMSTEIAEQLSAQALCDAWLDRPSIVVSVERKEGRREVDARPQILGLTVLPEEDGALCWALRLQTGQGVGVRPQAIMTSLLREAPNGMCEGWETRLRVARTALILDDNR
ncbi:MAG: B12-binding domain-containing radical SAM protein [Candidatus Methylomirabilota bacterium]|nr:MAG: B12-binding domain-containing radical SAM protein [candidate division NC10 bacterium]